MKVYHGSDILKCKPNKDFGTGFYVTALRQQAMDMAVRVSKWSGNKPVVTEFEFDEFAWEDDELHTLRFDSYNEQWLDFIILNRSGGKKQKHQYDIIEGPVADDAVVSRMMDYLDGIVSKQDFLKELSFYKKNSPNMFLYRQITAFTEES